jgi:hypothetical protein
MAKKNVHVTKRDNGWAVKTEKSDRAVKITEAQKEAIDLGRSIAKNNNSELIIHDRNNKIREKDSHGKDPSSIKG